MPCNQCKRVDLGGLIQVVKCKQHFHYQRMRTKKRPNNHQGRRNDLPKDEE